MVDASQVYDTIHLDVTVGGGFEAAQGKIANLIGQLSKLGKMVTPININTTQIDQAIAKLQGLSRGMAPGGGAGAGRRGRDVTGTLWEDPRWAYREKMRIREAETRRFEEFERMPPKYGTHARRAHLGAMRGPARGEMEAAGIPYKDIGTETPKATENLSKLNKEMGETATRAADVGKTMPKIPAAMSGVTNSLKAAVPAAEAARVKLDALKLTGGDMKPALREAAVAQNNLKNAITGATKVLPKGSKELAKANREAKKLGRTMEGTKKKTSAYTLTWKNMSMVMGKVAFWMVATGAIYGTIRAFKSLIDVVIKVDHAMADIEKVYRGAKGDLIPLRNSLIELSVALGGNSEATMEAAVGWARLGYTGKQISELMGTSMLAMNIAELTAAESTKYLTAAMIQFKLGADDSLMILDSWNELSNRTAATTKDLGEVVARAGKTYETMGDSIDYVNAVGATLVETMARSGEEVGTAMRTIGSYIYRKKSMKAIRELGGVEARVISPQGEVTGGLRAQSEILGELAIGWDNMSKAQQVALAQAVAGARRYQYFLNIMDNYDKVMRNLTISLNAAGSAERENARYMETIQKSLDQLRARFERAAVAAGDTGLAGTLKGLISILSFLVDALATIDFKMIALAIGVRVLTGLMIKLVMAAKAAGGFKLFVAGLRNSLAGVNALNVSLLVIIGTYHALKYAINKATEAAKEHAQWQMRATGATQGQVTATEADARAMAGYRKAMEYYRSAAETTKDEKKRIDYAKRATDAEEKYNTSKKALGITTVDLAEAEYEANLMVIDSKSAHIDMLQRDIEASERMVADRENAISVIERYNDKKRRGIAVTAEETAGFKEAKTEIRGATEEIYGASGAWDKLWQIISTGGTVHMGSVDLAKAATEELAATKDEKIKELGIAQQDLVASTDELADSEEDLGDAVGGTGREVDALAALIKMLDELMRPLNRSITETEHSIKLYEYALNALEQTYGDYSSEMAINNVLADDMNATYAKLIRFLETKRTELQKHIGILERQREVLIASGADISAYKDQWDRLHGELREVDLALLGVKQTMRDLPDEELEKFVNILTGETATRRARGEAFSSALPSKAGAKKYYDELMYVFDEMAAVAEETGQKMVSTNALLRVEYMTRREIHAVLVDMGYQGQALTEMEERMIKYQEIKLGYARELNQEYQRLANTFQNIVDEGLFGIIMGEQTAIDLAKELGREWADIALKTVTQPATEMFGAGMGGAAFFMKHGKLPPAMGGGIADVKLKDGRVPVYDEALAGAVMAAGGGAGLGGAGVSGIQGAGQPGAGGPGALGTIMPIAGGMMTGGLMGAGGGGAGAGFGAMMGGIGGAVSLIPGWGQIAGAGISLLGLLGNLFGGGKHEEEDPYANQQAAGMGERSVSIGSAGTVNNHVYITMYYESSLEKVDAERLFDAVEEVGVQRGYQVTGNPTPATV